MRQNTPAQPPASTAPEDPAPAPDLTDLLEIATIPALPMTRTTEGLRNLTATITGFTVAILAEVPSELMREALLPMTAADMAAEAAFIRHCHKEGLRLRDAENARNRRN
jgi:hypothetical protein